MRVTDLFPGPKYEGPQAQRFRLARGQQIQGPFSTPVPSPDHSVDYCSGCGWCTTACPAGVKIAEMNNQARARLREGKRPKIRDWGLGQTDLTGRMGVAVSPLANAVLGNGLARSAMELTVGIHRKAPLPKFAKRTFQAQWKRQGGTTGADGRGAARPGRGRRLLPWLRRELLRAARRGRGDRGPAPQRVRDHRPAAGLLRPADDQQRPV